MHRVCAVTTIRVTTIGSGSACRPFVATATSAIRRVCLYIYRRACIDMVAFAAWHGDRVVLSDSSSTYSICYTTLYGNVSAIYEAEALPYNGASPRAAPT